MVDTEQAENLSNNENGTEELQPIEGEVLADDQSGDADGDEAEEFEIVLGSAEEPSAEEEPHKKPKKKGGIRKLLDKNRAKDGRIAELERENEALRTGAPQTNTQANAEPTLESCGYDENVYQQQSKQHRHAEFNQLLDERENGGKRAKEAAAVSATLQAHYDRVEKLRIPNYQEAEDSLIEILGEEAVKQIAQVVPNSEMVITFLGKAPNKSKAFDLLETWQQEGAGGALFKLGELSKDVRAVPKQRKQRPQPESKVSGAAPASKTSLEKEIDSERKRIENGEIRDFTQLQRLKKQLRAAS